MEEKCKVCGEVVKGYKCADCGKESDIHEENHGCGSDRTMPKCVACNEAEENCDCDK